MEGDAYFRITLGEFYGREKDLKREEMVWIEAGIHAENVKQAGAQQASASK